MLEAVAADQEALGRIARSGGHQGDSNTRKGNSRVDHSGASLGTTNGYEALEMRGGAQVSLQRSGAGPTSSRARRPLPRIRDPNVPPILFLEHENRRRGGGEACDKKYCSLPRAGWEGPTQEGE